MNSTLPTYSYKSPALYNPRLWNANEVRAYYVARPTLLDRIVEDLRRESTNNHPQHRLIVGLRGMGKSTLLRRIAVAIEDDAQLNATWLPLSFPEEQYNVASLSDFWLNCLDALSDLLESRGETSVSANLDAEVEHLDRKDGEGALGALLRAAKTQQRRLLLLVDNIDLIFERIKAEDWKLRDALQAHPEILIIGASAKVLEDTYDYKAAFYDFFKVDELRGLSEAEMRETIVNLASIGNAQHIIDRIDADRARLRVLHTLTGGNPRTAVLLYGVLLKGIDGDVRSDLEGLLDEVTPLYKARFEELPAQSQQMLDKLALHWHPANAGMLAKQLGWKVNLVSAQLDRLIGAGIVERVKAPKSKRLNFQIGERFFNIWYLMRTSRRLRQRLIWFVLFLRAFFSAAELQAIVAQRISARPNADIREAETLIALRDALDEPRYKRVLADRALEILRSIATDELIADLFDFEGKGSDVRQRQQLLEIKSRVSFSLALIGAEDGGEELREYLETSVLDADDYHELDIRLGDPMRENWVDDVRKYLKQTANISVAAFGRAGARRLATATRSALIVGLHDRDGWEAHAIAQSDMYYSAFAQLFRPFDNLLAKGNEIELSACEQACETLLGFDQSGYLPWMVVGILWAWQGKRDKAVAAETMLATLPGSPVPIALMNLSYLIRDGAQEWLKLAPDLLRRVDVSNPKHFAALMYLAQAAVNRSESRNLLQVWDTTFQDRQFNPFRDALSAAAHNDPDLLELLAPEVREPAKRIFASFCAEINPPSVDEQIPIATPSRQD